MRASTWFQIAGSARLPAVGAVLIGEAEGDNSVEVGIWLNSMYAGVRNHAAAISSLPLCDRAYVGRDSLDEKFGSDPTVVRAVHAFAERHALKVVQRSERSRLIRLSVPLSKVTELFWGATSQLSNA